MSFTAITLNVPTLNLLLYYCVCYTYYNYFISNTTGSNNHVAKLCINIAVTEGSKQEESNTIFTYENPRKFRNIAQMC